MQRARLLAIKDLSCIRDCRARASDACAAEEVVMLARLAAFVSVKCCDEFDVSEKNATPLLLPVTDDWRRRIALIDARADGTKPAERFRWNELPPLATPSAAFGA